jgi:CRISPR-associated protein Cas1
VNVFKNEEGYITESTSIKSARITGVKVNYFFVCKRKLWLFDHNLEMEHTSDYVALGNLLHEESYPRQAKEVLINDLIRIDFIDSESVLHDVKLGKSMEEDMNTRLLNFLSQKHVPIHLFNYYGYYSGSYYPREYLNSGFLLVKQVEHYQNNNKRMAIAREFVKAAAHNILRNLTYYENRKENDGSALQTSISNIQQEMTLIDESKTTNELMGIEGRIRQQYYQNFNDILNTDMAFEKRVRRPPDNPINALISFGNSLMYSAALTEIYRTQLNPTISFLHEPGERRFSLSLDLAEIFKPIIVDRAIFKLINKQMLGPELAKDHDFEQQLDACYLTDNGRKIFLAEFDERLNTTIQHRRLKRNVSYQRLVRLECYKLQKHLLDMEPYEAFRCWW